ncbi:hypothetical protein Q5752_000482 [Cryptotrichosporon argae]
MRFSTRNAFYLRVSNYRVVPLFLYLDERHVDWMSDRVLQLVIGELQGKMENLLLRDRGQKKHKVHVERGDTYQYCYFLRSTTRTEVVLLKRKTYSLRPPSPPREPSPPPPTTSRKRKAPSSAARASCSRSRSVTALPVRQGLVVPDEDEDEVVVKPEPDAGDDDDEVAERGIKDYKPDVDVTYQGFGTSSVQLVLIVEPYPPLPPTEYAPPSSRLSSRSTSVAQSRARTNGTGRYSSTSLALDQLSSRASAAYTPNVRNARNASRSVSRTPVPGGGGRWGESSTPAFGRERSTSYVPGAGAGGRERTPLFLPRDTPFDDEDDELHEAYEAALREGRRRLPSVGPRDDAADDDVMMDLPEGMREIGQRLVRSSQIEEGVIRSLGGWEEREAGEESAVLGKEEPGD